MKRLFILAISLYLAACGGSSGGSSNTTTATTPLDSRCITNSTLCNNQVYGQYSGWMPYSYPYGNTSYNYQTYFNTYGVCGCPTGYMPAYNANMGIGCFRTRQVGIDGLTMAFNFSINNGYGAPQRPINMPQYSNINVGAGNCSRNVATSCLITQINSCGVGATCQQVGYGSDLGVCVNSNYYNGNGYGNGHHHRRFNGYNSNGVGYNYSFSFGF